MRPHAWWNPDMRNRLRPTLYFEGDCLDLALRFGNPYSDPVWEVGVEFRVRRPRLWRALHWLLPEPPHGHAGKGWCTFERRPTT